MRKKNVYEMNPIGILRHLKGHERYVNAGWSPNWSNEHQLKFHPSYRHTKGEWVTVTATIEETSFFHFPSTHRCNRFIEDNKRLLTTLRNLLHTEIENIL